MTSFINRRTITIEWGDCDPAGIVFYPRYFEFFNASTDALFGAAGFHFRDLVHDYGIIGYPMIDTSATFMLPSGYGDELVIESSASSWGRSSFGIDHKVLKAGEVAILASERRVWAKRTPEGPIRGVATPAHIVDRLMGRDSEGLG